MFMFEAPTPTLLTSLKQIFNHPKEYLADVCFHFKQNDVYAHRALILTRAPRQFIDKYLPQLLNDNDKLLELDIHHVIDYDMFLPLLRFWYTADFYDNTGLVSPCSDIPTHYDTNYFHSPPLSPPLSSSSLTSTPQYDKYDRSNEIKWATSATNDVSHELDKLSKQLGTPLLPLRSDTVPDFTQLVHDLKRMLNDQIATDITLSLVTATPFYDHTFKPATTTTTEDSPQTQAQAQAQSQSSSQKSADQNNQVDSSLLENSKPLRAHKFILAAQSSYFYNMFCTEFQEASTSIIHFTSDLFNESILDLICHFLYTDQINVKPLPSPLDKSRPTSSHQQRLQHNRHLLRVIQKTFYASDYIGQGNTLGIALLHEMEKLCHHFKCVCTECAMLLPSMLVWSDKHCVMVPKLRRTLILLYSDPVHSLPTLWSQRPFAYLVSSIVPCASSLGDATLNAVLKNEPLFRARPSKTLIHEIYERIFCNITKHNAIHVLHTLHLCLSQIRSTDPTPSWSRPVLDLVHPLLHYTVMIVSEFFDFYCVEYPILLSCVDGIGAGFSVDFLDFLLLNVLDELEETNAPIIYQGIVRDLVGRQEVVKNMAIDDVLIRARARCANFIAKHWTGVKSKGGFHRLDKATLRQLSEDTGIPYRSLAKPFDNEFSNIFSFKSKHHKKSIDTNNRNEQLTRIYTRRLSLGNMMTRSQPSTIPKPHRPRALSTESAVQYPSFSLSSAMDSTNNELQNLSLIHLLFSENDRPYNKKHTNEDAEEEEEEGEEEEEQQDRPALLRTSASFDSLTDLLLPIDNQIRSHPLPEKKESGLDDTDERQSRHLKFELPITPPRSKSPINNINTITSSSSIQYQQQNHSSKNKKKSGRRPRWSIGSNSSDTSDEESIPTVGDKIELLRRPLPTLGTIKYIGPVEFANGTYIGVELESRLGKIDGSVDGIRYFHTDPQRGLLIRPDAFKIIHPRK